MITTDQRYRALVEATALVVWRAAASGAIIEQTGWDIFCGAREDHYLGNGWLDLIHPEDLDRVRAAWAKSVEQGRHHEAEYRLRHISGSYRWVVCRGVPLTTASGEVGEWVGTITDIDLCRRAMDTLRKSEERYRALVEEGATFVWTTAPDGNAEFLQGWREFTGLTQCDPLGDGWAVAVHPEDRTRVLERWRSTVATGETFSETYRMWNDAASAYRWVRARGVPIKNDDNSVREWVGSVTDTHDKVIASQRQALVERRYHALVDSSASAVWACAPDGTVLEAFGEGFKTLFGVEPDDARNWSSAIHFADLDAVIEKRKRACEEGLPYQQEFRTRRQDGEYRWTRSCVVPVKDQDGRLLEWHGFARDIDAEKQSEVALRNSEERLRLAVEAAGLGYFDLDMRTGKSAWSDELRATVGITAFGATGPEQLLSRAHVGDLPALCENLEEAMRRPDGQFGSQVRIRRASDNEERWLELHGRVHFDPDGRPVRRVGVVRDITDQRQAEIRLKASEDRYRFLADHSSDCIVQADERGRLVYVSPSVTDILGYAPAAPIGSRILSHVPRQDRTHLKPLVRALMGGDAVQATRQLRLMRRDGTAALVEVKLKTVARSDGTPTLLASLRDISEREKIETRLRHSQKMEAIGHLTGHIAHDFNNLLMVILGNAELLSETLTDASSRALAEMIQSASQKGADLSGFSPLRGASPSSRSESMWPPPCPAWCP